MYTIKGGIMAVYITIELDFRAFMSANNPCIANRRGYCPLYITFNYVHIAEQTREKVPNHVHYKLP